MRAEHDLGTIVRAHGESFVRLHRTTAAQRAALRAISSCRTPALGGQRQRCTHCGYEHIQWHSCRSRCCPRCQGAACAAWVEARRSELLPVPYFHVVFTVPHELNAIARRAPRLFYDLLFRSAAATLTDVALSRLRVRIGALAVLHTWTQTLLLHPHVHCVVPGGGFSIDRPRWMGVRKRSFFLPVRVLSKRFRTLFCNAIIDAPLPPSIDRTGLRVLLAGLRAKEWVVYAKPPFGGPAQVLAYLANYTHRIAISNSRIVAFTGDHVSFRYRDAPGSQREMTLHTDEFLRRFLLHVIPKRFVRIRYYGFMANRARASSLERARRLIGYRAVIPSAPPRPAADRSRCPVCHSGAMRCVELVQPPKASCAFEDTS